MPLKLIQIFALALLILFFFGTSTAVSQELPPPDEQQEINPQITETVVSEDEGLPQDEPPFESAEGEPETTEPEIVLDPLTGDLITGTEIEARQAEESLFGSDEAEPGDEEELEEAIEGTHLLKFRFTSRVAFKNPDEPSPYVEIEYVSNFEIPIFLEPARKTKEAEATFEVQNWGQLAGNEFFFCDLEILPPETTPVAIISRLNRESAEESEEEIYSAALRISFKEKGMEDWFSNCTDIASGAQLNTQGAPEQYNMQVLAASDPQLSALVFKEFDPIEGGTLTLTSPETIIEDQDINNNVTTSGEGTVELEPF